MKCMCIDAGCVLKKCFSTIERVKVNQVLKMSFLCFCFLGCNSSSKYLCDFNRIKQQLMFWVNKR